MIVLNVRSFMCCLVVSGVGKPTLAVAINLLLVRYHLALFVEYHWLFERTFCLPTAMPEHAIEMLYMIRHAVRKPRMPESSRPRIGSLLFGLPKVASSDSECLR